jgi:hypothetical protein
VPSSGFKHPTDERTGRPRPLRPPGKRHGLPDRYLRRRIEEALGDPGEDGATNPTDDGDGDVQG